MYTPLQKLIDIKKAEDEVSEVILECQDCFFPFPVTSQARQKKGLAILVGRHIGCPECKSIHIKIVSTSNWDFQKAWSDIHYEPLEFSL